MESYLALVGAFAVGLAIGLVIGRIRWHRDQLSSTDADGVTRPLSKEEYEKSLAKADERYHDAMALYDKLVPWAAGGALVVSLSFVSSFSKVVPRESKWILASAWGALVLALLSSILSQYSSTRIQVWRMAYLRSRQNPPKKSADDATVEKWRNEILEFQRKSSKSGRWTKRLNVSGGVLLIVGLLALGGFAILAVPFGNGAYP